MNNSNEKVLVVLWENYNQGRTNSVEVVDSRLARVVADNFRVQRRRRADVIPLTPENLKRFVG